MDMQTDTAPSVETIAELAHLARAGRREYEHEAIHATFTEDERAEADRRWAKVQHLLLSLEVEARDYPVTTKGFVKCFRIVRGGIHAGVADREQFPSQAEAQDAMDERFSLTEQRFELLRIVPAPYLTPNGYVLRKEVPPTSRHRI